MKRLNIALEEKQHIRAKVAAALKEKSLNEYIVNAIMEQIEKDKSLLKEMK
ncbi:toxin-antitoxin system HicB family antitoxin [Candidatus Woesearchaeota archaeon]|nr:toxin-antitoxin system HicB family antitoxin [Candidatus Woesearchaeota archaeon]